MKSNLKYEIFKMQPSFFLYVQSPLPLTRMGPFAFMLEISRPLIPVSATTSANGYYTLILEGKSCNELRHYFSHFSTRVLAVLIYIESLTHMHRSVRKGFSI